MKPPSDLGKDCARSWEVMPWALQNRVSPAEDEWLTSHLTQCESCRSEFEQQSRLRMALTLPPDIPLNPDAGLRRLLARIDAPDAQETSQRARATGWITRTLVAAVLVQALGIGVLGVKLWSQNAVPVYHTLSQANPAAPVGAIHVVPDESMRLSDWNSLLHTMHLQVVGGPNDVGAYTVVSVDTSLSPRDTLQKLRTTQGIRLAEPVAAAP
ncbi:zf-HC2 domain-containing protein [Dyella solisilvae]|uniref:Zf-HC2 domain-containing protein n=1 Tax=Dyella solisilvae TaxID=1920168 RepID=A0A370K5R8_9GAMM|nr:zf-HC2 domain-containing protein [Dyella solisilvae]RDI97991.1 zf-HC2 domain-containing protein [Dyella solisilvae]